MLTGGRGRRLGADKAATEVGGRTLLHRVTSSIPHEVPLIVCGPPPRPEPQRPYLLTREDPPGGGPVAGLAAAVALVETPVLVALATDLPFLGSLPATLADELVSAPGVDALIAVDPAGRAQPLLAGYRTAALGIALDSLDATDGASMRQLLAHLRPGTRRSLPTTVVPTWRSVPADRPLGIDPTMDVDTPQDLARARGAAIMQDWIAAVRQELGGGASTGALDVDAVLDVARDVAHNVQRPAAPVTTYLLGLAVGSGMSLAEAAKKVQDLTTDWPAEQ